MIGNHVHNKAFFRNSEHKTNESGSISHRDSEFFLCPTPVTRRKTFFMGHLLLMSTSNPCYHSGTLLTCVFPLTIW